MIVPRKRVCWQKHVHERFEIGTIILKVRKLLVCLPHRFPVLLWCMRSREKNMNPGQSLMKKLSEGNPKAGHFFWSLR